MPSLLIGSPRCQCSACGEYFKSPTSFDMHRIWLANRTRGCETVKRMLGRGMCKNAAGFWISKQFQEAA